MNTKQDKAYFQAAPAPIMPTVSIVVPVFKVESYLDRCIGSILNQTHNEYELFFVDDGSPDNCGNRCDNYAIQDGRFLVIHQANSGLSAARNSALNLLYQGNGNKWLTFVDSDDWIHPRYLELLLRFSEKNNISICMAECRITDKIVKYQDIPNDIFTIEQTEKAFTNSKLDPPAAWARLYQKKLFQNLRFPVGKLHEDRFTTYKLYFQFKSIGVIHTPLYFYFVNPASITHVEWHPRKLDNLEAAEQQLMFFQKTANEEMYLYILKDYVNLCIYALRCIGQKKEYKQYQNIVRNKLRRILRKEHRRLDYHIKEQYNIYKYAYPFLMKVYRRLFL